MIFLAILIITLFVFQVLLLEPLYKSIRYSTIKTASRHIENNLSAAHFGDYFKSICVQNQFCGIITDADGNVLFSSDNIAGCMIHEMDPDERKVYVTEALSSSGDAYGQNIRLDTDVWTLREYLFGGYDASKGPEHQNYLYIKPMSTEDGAYRILLIESSITPLKATMMTLRVQLIYIILFMTFVATILAFVFSRYIAAPIRQINASALAMAQGDYSVTFDEGGYLEIEELNRTLNYTVSELKQAEDLRRELLANISHDLRTPLTMITGYAEMMRDIPNENTPENAQVIVDESKRLTMLVNDMLDLSRLQAGAQSLSMSVYNLTDQIEEIIGRHKKFMAQNDYKLTFEHGEDIYVNADSIRIGQVIYNYLNNALTHTGEDKVVIIRQETRDDRVRISVIDTGAGIPAEQLPYIWDRYYKIDKTHRRHAIGTGLGLSIVKAILEKHKAEYGVISKEGEGSCFYFELPIARYDVKGRKAKKKTDTQK